MSKKKTVILGHGHEHSKVVTYESLDAPVAAERVVLLPLCSEKAEFVDLAPCLAPTIAGADRVAMVVPLLNGSRIVDKCSGGYTGDYACARCVFGRWLRLLGYEPSIAEGVALFGPSKETETHSDDKNLAAYLRKNIPAFGIEIATAEAKSLGSFRLSGIPVAISLRGVLIVQHRKSKISSEEVTWLCSVKRPRRPRAERYEDQDLLETDEAAEYLGIAKGTLQNWIYEKKVPYTKIGGRVKFLFGPLRKWVESQTFEPADSQAGEFAEPEGFLWEEDEDA